MSRLARAVEILEAINDFFQEHDGQTVLYSDSQILDGEISIKDAIADCLGREESEGPIVPHSQRKRIVSNPYTGWSGWIGKRKIKHFETATEAYKWVNEN